MGVACLLLGALLSLNFQKLVSDLNNFIIFPFAHQGVGKIMGKKKYQ